MCIDCTVQVYIDYKGTTWYYRVHDTLQRSTDKLNWNEVTDEDLAEMTENHLDFVSELVVP
jgi:uncharacterized protein (DUF427 family)